MSTAERRAQRKRLSALANSFDLRWARWLVTLTAPLPAAHLLLQTQSLQSSHALALVAGVGTGAFGVMLCLYFAWLLFRRLQYSLLELLVLVAFLGNLEGLLLTMPRFVSLASGTWALVPLSAAWILYGAVMTLTQARILEVEKLGPRVLLLLANWWILAAPALIVLGGVLCFGGNLDGMVSRGMAAWGAPLLAIGAAGCILYVWLSGKTRRAARGILGLGERKNA
jgi:hypothetical protein